MTGGSRGGTSGGDRSGGGGGVKRERVGKSAQGCERVRFREKENKKVDQYTTDPGAEGKGRAANT